MEKEKLARMVKGYYSNENCTSHYFFCSVKKTKKLNPNDVSLNSISYPLLRVE